MRGRKNKVGGGGRGETYAWAREHMADRHIRRGGGGRMTK